LVPGIPIAEFKKHISDVDSVMLDPRHVKLAQAMGSFVHDGDDTHEGLPHEIPMNIELLELYDKFLKSNAIFVQFRYALVYCIFGLNVNESWWIKEKVDTEHCKIHRLV
jgi:hypothetical protein